MRWHRPPVYTAWENVQPDLAEPVYHWDLPDLTYGSAPSEIQLLGNITAAFPRSRQAKNYVLPHSYRPVDEQAYSRFVEAAVERYDGDGIDDMPGLTNPVMYWQVGNEPNDEALADFAVLQRISYEAIKRACSDCTVLMGGVAGFPRNYIHGFDTRHAPILVELAGRYVDIFDFHWYGTVSDYRLVDPTSGGDVLEHIRSTLAKAGFEPTIPIWVTELGAYSGSPKPLGPDEFPPQNERQQAADYFKRFVYLLSRGVARIFPAFGLIEGFKQEDGYFDHTGLVYDGRDQSDPGVGVRKLGYYTYKKRTELLEGADWRSLTELHDGSASDRLHLFRLHKGSERLYIGWWDTFDDPGYTAGATKELTISDLTGSHATITAVIPDAVRGSDVATYASAFARSEQRIAERTLTVSLGEDPLAITVSR